MKSLGLKFGLMALAVVLLIQLSKYSLLTRNASQELILSLVALGLIAIGVVLARQIFPPKKGVLENEVVAIDENAIEKLGISKREYEVLQEIALGKSNQEIAETLFISESTVKTHVSNLLVKLDAKRRTQAVSKAKAVRII